MYFYSSSRLYYLLFCFLFQATFCFAQPQPLQPGDTLPANVLASITAALQPASSGLQPVLSFSKGQSPASRLTTHDSRLTSPGSPLIILDFFATWCGACIAELPRLDSLQQEFTGRVNIFLIARESGEKMQALRKRNKVFARSCIPVIAEDSLLSQYFPHTILPHQVWLTASGKVLAITGGGHATKHNINAALSGSPFRLPLKQDVLSFDRNKPLLLSGNGGTEEQLLFRSLFTRHLSGMLSGSGISNNADSTSLRIWHINRPVLDLIAWTYNYHFQNRIFLLVKDSCRFFPPAQHSQDWQTQACFSYELTVPATFPLGKAKEIMKQDLARYLELNIRLETRAMHCYVIRPLQEISANRTKHKTPATSVPLKQYTLSFFINWLNAFAPGMPPVPVFVNETGWPENTNLSLPGNLSRNIEWLNEYLFPLGLVIEPAQREMQTLVISDSNH